MSPLSNNALPVATTNAKMSLPSKSEASKDLAAGGQVKSAGQGALHAPLGLPFEKRQKLVQGDMVPVYLPEANGNVLAYKLPKGILLHFCQLAHTQLIGENKDQLTLPANFGSLGALQYLIDFLYKWATTPGRVDFQCPAPILKQLELYQCMCALELTCLVDGALRNSITNWISTHANRLLTGEICSRIFALHPSDRVRQHLLHNLAYQRAHHDRYVNAGASDGVAAFLRRHPALTTEVAEREVELVERVKARWEAEHRAFLEREEARRRRRWEGEERRMAQVEKQEERVQRELVRREREKKRAARDGQCYLSEAEVERLMGRPVRV